MFVLVRLDLSEALFYHKRTKTWRLKPPSNGADYATFKGAQSALRNMTRSVRNNLLGYNLAIVSQCEIERRAKQYHDGEMLSRSIKFMHS